MKKHSALQFVFHFLMVCTALAQETSFVFRQSVPVVWQGRNLSLAWAGGLNAPQLSTEDFNGDGRPDLFVFDRTQGKVSIFLSTGEAWAYAPDYEAAFPVMTGWALLRDFDNDGRKDLLTSTRFGIQVLAQQPTATALPSFRSVADPLLTTGLSGDSINLRIDLTDIAHFGDIDGDGAMDILNFMPSVGFSMEYHKNQSVNGLALKKVDTEWGGIIECSCDVFGFGGSSCRLAAAEHAGSTILAFDADNDGDMDLLLGDVDCRNLAFLENKGSRTQARFDSFDTQYPPSRPVDMAIFPAPFLEDVTFDGLPDLLVAPNVFFNENDQIDFRKSFWLYRNTGTSTRPDFAFVQEDFLQSDMLDLGEEAHPAFVDMDADGDLDMLIAYRGNPTPAGFEGGISFFENTGSPQNPAFVYRGERCQDCQGLSSIRVAAGEGVVVISGYAADTRLTRVWRMDNGQTLTGINFGIQDDLAIMDWNNDGYFDLLVGRRNGALDVFVQQGETGNFVLAQANLGGIGQHPTKRFLRIGLGDLNQDGELDLVRGDLSGALSVYFSIRSQGENWTDVPVEVFSGLDQQHRPYHWGTRPKPAVFGSDLVIGTGAGGLLYLQNRQYTNATAAEEASAVVLRVFPNPSQGTVSVSSTSEGQLTLSNLLGQVLGQHTLAAEVPLRLSLDGMPKGVYLLTLTHAKGRITRRLAIAD